MDDPSLDAGQHRAALRGLARLNAWSRAVPTMAAALERVADKNESLRVLDVASGGGDVVAALARRFPNWSFHGCDNSPEALAVAGERGGPVSYSALNALCDPWPAGYDVATCSLFLHHLEEDDAIALLRRFGSCGACVVFDLDRRRRALWLARLASRALTRSPVVHEDAPQSVRNAYTAAEARSLAERAGLFGARVRRVWPYRWILTWRQ